MKLISTAAVVNAVVPYNTINPSFADSTSGCIPSWSALTKSSINVAAPKFTVLKLMGNEAIVVSAVRVPPEIPAAALATDICVTNVVPIVTRALPPFPVGRMLVAFVVSLAV